MPFMRTSADLVRNPESLGHIRRAHQGVCWTLGIPVLPRKEDSLDVQIARRAALRAVIESANGGTYGVQILRQAALQSLRPFLARSFRLSAA